MFRDVRGLELGLGGGGRESGLEERVLGFSWFGRLNDFIGREKKE